MQQLAGVGPMLSQAMHQIQLPAALRRSQSKSFVNVLPGGSPVAPRRTSQGNSALQRTAATKSEAGASSKSKHKQGAEAELRQEHSDGAVNAGQGSEPGLSRDGRPLGWKLFPRDEEPVSRPHVEVRRTLLIACSWSVAEGGSGFNHIVLDDSSVQHVGAGGSAASSEQQQQL